MDIFPQWDTDLFLWLNGCRSTVADHVMWLLSQTYTSIPLYLLLLYWLYRKYPNNKSRLIVVLSIGLLILLSDQISSGICKPLFLRLRPTHQPEIADLVYTVNNYRGGLYGFVSSHAANCFAVAVFTSLLLQRKVITIVMLAWAAVVSYSRIYLGVHYPLDIFCGMLVGVLSGYLTATLFLYVNRRITKGRG